MLTGNAEFFRISSRIILFSIVDEYLITAVRMIWNLSKKGVLYHSAYRKYYEQKYQYKK